MKSRYASKVDINIPTNEVTAVRWGSVGYGSSDNDLIWKENSFEIDYSSSNDIKNINGTRAIGKNSLPYSDLFETKDKMFRYLISTIFLSW